MVKPDIWIKKMVREYRMIEPFCESQIRKCCISYGLSSYGYDMRIANEFQIPISDYKDPVDPKDINKNLFKTIKSDDFIILKPASFVLGKSVEYFRIPRDILAISFGKSTYARCGIIVNVTPFEPEWEGFVTISISNTSSLPTKLYVNEGIAQVIFLKADEICEISYSDRKGKYQAQEDITHAKV